MRKIKVLTILLAFVMLFSNVFAIETGLGSWFPPDDAKSVPSDYNYKTRAVSSDEKGALVVPKKKSAYAYPILGSSDGVKKKGTGVSYKNNGWEWIWKWIHGDKITKADGDKYWAFYLDDNKEIEIHYPGLFIYNRSKDVYEEVTLKVEVVKYNAKTSYYPKVPGPFMTIARSIGKNKGLPVINFANVGSAQVKYTFLNSKGKALSTKTNVTWGDIDGEQCVSINKSAMEGHVVYKGGTKLRVASYDKWYSFIGPNKSAPQEVSANSVKGAFMIDGSHFYVIYNTGGKGTYSGSGGWSHFAPSTYVAPPDGEVEIPNPKKGVYDNGDTYTDLAKNKRNANTNDVKIGTHNTIVKKGDVFLYTIALKLPPLMYSERSLNGQRFTKFVFKDTLDDCLELAGPIEDNVTVRRAVRTVEKDEIFRTDYWNYSAFPHDKSIRDDFQITQSGQTITVAWKNKLASNAEEDDMYGDGQGSYIFVKIRAKIKSSKTLTQVGQDTVDRVPHLNGNNIDIPNTAKLIYTLDGGKETTKEANVVKTRIKAPGKLIIRKVDEAGNLITSSPAKFNVKQGSTAVKSNLTTADGKVTINEIEAGTYTVEEAQAPNGYIKSSSSVSATVTGGNTTTVEFKNYKPSIKIVKLDSETKQPINGASFTIYEVGSATPVNYLKVNGTTRASGIFTANEEIKNLTYGTRYKIVETTVPHGYTGAADYIHDTKKYNTSTVVEIERLNTPIKKDIKIRKTDENDLPLTGAEFELRQDSTSGTLLDTKTVNNNAEATFTGLKYGTYYVVEKTPPKGYNSGAPLKVVVDDTITVTRNNEPVLLTNGAYNIPNPEKPKANFSFVKINGTDQSSPANAPILGGATFRLYGPMDKGGNLNMTSISDATTGLVSFTNIPEGTYTLEETVYPDGFMSKVSKYTLKVTNGTATLYNYNTTNAAVAYLSNSNYTFSNTAGAANNKLPNLEAPTKTLWFQKKDTNGNIMPNVEFKFTGTSNSGAAINLEGLVSDENGILTIRNVPAGTYTLQETKVPAGFLEKRSWQVVVNIADTGGSGEHTHTESNEFTMAYCLDTSEQDCSIDCDDSQTLVYCPDCGKVKVLAKNLRVCALCGETVSDWDSYIGNWYSPSEFGLTVNTYTITVSGTTATIKKNGTPISGNTVKTTSGTTIGTTDSNGQINVGSNTTIRVCCRYQISDGWNTWDYAEIPVANGTFYMK